MRGLDSWISRGHERQDAEPGYQCDQHVWQSPDEPCPNCAANDEWAEYLRTREYGEGQPLDECEHGVSVRHAGCGKCEGL